MRRLFFRVLIRLALFATLVYILTIQKAKGQDENESRRAMKALQRAALSYSEVRMYKRNAENFLFKIMPVDKTDLVYFSPLAAIIDRRISTTKFKNLVWKRDSLVIDPDITYAYTEDIWLMSLNFKYTF